MKRRFLTSFLTMAVMLSMFMTPGIGAYAAEDTTTDAEDIFQSTVMNVDTETTEIMGNADQFTTEMMSRAYQAKVEALSKEVFPEYANRTYAANSIGTLNAGTGAVELGDVVYSETRQVSETEELKYIQYSSGRAGYLYVKGWNSTEQYPDIEGTRYIRTLVITVPGCVGSIYVQGLNYTIKPRTYDMINDQGVCYGGVGSYYQLNKRYEDGSGPAKSSYGGNLRDLLLDYPVGVAFSVEVGNNTVRVFDPSGTEI